MEEQQSNQDGVWLAHWNAGEAIGGYFDVFTVSGLWKRSLLPSFVFHNPRILVAKPRMAKLSR